MVLGVSADTESWVVKKNKLFQGEVVFTNVVDVINLCLCKHLRNRNSFAVDFEEMHVKVTCASVHTVFINPEMYAQRFCCTNHRYSATISLG